MALQGSKLTSGAWLFVCKVEINFDSVKEAIYKVLKKGHLFFPISTGKFPVRTKSEAAKYDFPVSFLFFFFTFSLSVLF